MLCYEDLKVISLNGYNVYNISNNNNMNLWNRFELKNVIIKAVNTIKITRGVIIVYE